MSERRAWVTRGACGHIIDAWAGQQGTATREDFMAWLGKTRQPTIQHMTSQAVRDEGFCPGHPVPLTPRYAATEDVR